LIKDGLGQIARTNNAHSDQKSKGEKLHIRQIEDIYIDICIHFFDNANSGMFDKSKDETVEKTAVG
jgi:hypothetical protein